MRARQFSFSVFALLSACTFASAQAPVPAPRPVMTQSPYLQMEMVVAPVSYPHPGHPTEIGGYTAGGGGGCGCGPTVAASNARRSLFGGLLIGCGCAIPPGCNNFHSEKTFVFGSCRQFFNPGYQCGPRASCFGDCSGAGIGCCGIRGHEPCSKGGNSFLNK